MDCPAACPKKLELGVGKGKLDPAMPQPRVVIVGAGLAGLSAAWRLADAGFKNYQIYEATDRLGGRIHSCWVGDAVVELGPQWLTNAAVSNPLYSLAAQEGLLKPPMAWRRIPKDTPFLSGEGRALEARVVRPATGLFRKVREQAISLFGKAKGNLGDFMRLRFEEELKAVPEGWRHEVDKVFWGLANELKPRYGVSGDKLSREVLGSQVRLPGGSLRVPLGMLGILGPLLRKVYPKCVSTCKQVDNIAWKTGRGVVQVCISDGEAVDADLVLVTLPLGVLKDNVKLFTPCLPDDKIQAIERLGWATVNRFILNYDRPFWLPGEGFYRFTWDKEQRGNPESWLKGLSVVEEIPGAPHLLTFCLGDEEAKMVESCEDCDIADQITKAFRQFSGDSSLPHPRGVVRSRWGSDPHFLGSMSYLTPKSTTADYCELARPIPEERPVLLFAGEATAPGYTATLLGAHLSGIREAERILGLTRRLAASCPSQ